MNLPPLSIPDIALPFAIPEMMHPAIVHFAVALPVIIILLELINLAVRRKVVGSISFVLILLMVVVYFGAYLTGVADAHDAKKLLLPETKDLLKSHKLMGIWLVYGSVAVLFFKLISATVKKIPARIIFLAVLGLFFWGATGVVQKGCALTYKHGVNVHKDAPIASAPAAQPATQAPVKAAKDAPAQSPKENAPKTEGSAPAPATSSPAVVEEKVAPAAAIENAVPQASEKVAQEAQKVQEAAKAVEQKASEATDAAKETVEKAVESVPDAPAPATPATPITPVETVPAG